jgi:hypothetical protein
MTNAPYTVPAQVPISVKSATQRVSGAAAVKSRLSRSSGTGVGRIRHRGTPASAANHPGQAETAHQPLHRAPGHRGAVAPQLQPHLPRAIHAAAFLPVFPHPHDLPFQPLIPLPTARRITLTLFRRVICGYREFQDRARRFHPEPVTM